MALHTKITEQTGLPIYFCDPHSPWQRGTQREHCASRGGPTGLFRRLLPPLEVTLGFLAAARCALRWTRASSADTDLAHSSWLD